MAWSTFRASKTNICPSLARSIYWKKIWIATLNRDFCAIRWKPIRTLAILCTIETVVGTREGIQVGQAFTVGEVEVLRDPDTGEVLDESMTQVAALRVDEVKEKLSICSVTEGDATAVAKGMTIHLP